ncbi:MAG: single-stranded DNA-binding protein [Bacteroidales bacterium]
MSYNKVLLIGNVGKDPEVRHLESGASVASFTLATTERFKDKNGILTDQTEWHNIVCWRNLAELVEKYVNKGTQLFIEGKIRSRNWTDQAGQKKYITEIVADNIRLLGKRGDNNTAQQPQSPTQSGNQQAGVSTVANQNSQEPSSHVEESSDDLPF